MLLLVFGQLTLAEVANAIVPKQNDGSLESLTFVSEVLQASPESEALDDVRMTSAAAIVSAWDSFRVMYGGWSALIDQRTGKVESAEGEGIPFVPGRGNQLRMADISSGLGDDRDIDLAQMEAITRAFLPSVANLLGVDPATLILNQGRSGQPADYLWFVDFDVARDGAPIEGARVVFRVNNGNLIQFGTENLPAERVAVPKAKVTRDQALTILADYIGGFSAADSFMDGGSQHLVPVKLADIRFAEGFEQGKGRGLARVWQFVFRRDGNHGTWRARVDATSGKMLELRDLNDYASAQIAGGVTALTESEARPMPFADVSSGGYTNSAGVYDYTGGTVISALDGQYVKIIDNCGAISLASGTSGNLLFGTSSGADDCGTPGYGGAGNTNASRTQFYHLNRAKEIARGWLNLPWLTSQLTAHVNLDGICNSFWDGASISFIRRGTGCSNAGQIQGVGLHEFGHGLDTNDGNGPSPDKGTGETYADWTTALITHDSCIGSGYLTSNCDGYGDACTSCTGVRDIDYAKHVSAIPHTVGNFTQVLCPAGNAYNGPCGREGHCESQVSSEALWDLAVRDLPSLGLSSDSAWTLMERLWYLSRPTATAAFTCFRATSPWTSDGCGTGSLWKTLRAVDDDDGNLSNGTPHSAALYDAFDRHGIACASDVGATTTFRGCTQQPAAPIPSLTASNNHVTLSWSGSSGVYDIYRNEQGCDAGGFIKVANDLSTSSFTDFNVANDFAYFYKIVAQPSSNEACPSTTSECLEAGPCLPPAPPASLTANALSADQIDLSWTASSGATRYHIYRATNQSGPYTQIGTRSGTTFSDTGLSALTTYYYEVRAAKSETCNSASSIQVVATTTDSCSLTVSNSGAVGAGAVSSTPAGISCGADCSEPYAYNTSVTLTATPTTGYVFQRWNGACSGTSETCTVTMAQARWVQASFNKPELKVWLTSLAGSRGMVTIAPTAQAGFKCSSTSTNTTCTQNYDYDTPVTLVATPAEGSVFVGWSGACTGTQTCTVRMTRDIFVNANFSLPALDVDGEASSAVIGTPGGFYYADHNCGGAYGYGHCYDLYPLNTLVTLTATPSAGRVFLGWSGACSGTETCTVAMSRDRFVQASFANVDSLTQHTVMTSLAGTGNGTVTSDSYGIQCGRDCMSSFLTPVTLTATPAAGSVFDGWSGSCAGTGTCTLPVPMTGQPPRSVIATFSQTTHALTANLAGAGSGTVTSAPAGIQCGSDCNETYNHDTQVALTATPTTGSVFSGWSGACTGTGTVCVVAITEARSVTATFSVATHLLTASLAGTGSGTVTSTPAGISCGVDCSEVYSHNTQMTLTATPATGSGFSGWSGACTGSGTCTVTMTQAHSVMATFSSYVLKVRLSGAGIGTVTSTTAGINCGTDCSEAYGADTGLTLIATPMEGSAFSGWSGACTEPSSMCSFSMTQDRTVTAKFSVATHSLTASLAGTGSGTVTSTPAGISCGVDCSEAYNHNTQVTLAAAPMTGSVFSGWSGACTGTGTCTVTMTQARSVTATFSMAAYALTVSRTGTGSGTVTSTPAGINCGTDCSEAYNYNTQVTLTATPSSALFVFKGWTGACTGTGNCVVTMDQAKSATATFSDRGQDFYTVVPCRVYDTRVIGSSMTSDTPRIIQIAGACGVPATAKAVSLNVTAVAAPGQGFITLYPDDISSPGTWTNSFRPLLNQANNAIIPLAWNGAGTMAALAVISGGGSMDLVVDVNGYYE